MVAEEPLPRGEEEALSVTFAPGGLSKESVFEPRHPEAADGLLALDRIRIDRTHIVGSIDPVNPVYTFKVEQIHGG